MFYACFLFYVNGHIPAGLTTVVKGARVQLRQQVQYMTVSLFLSANCGFCKKAEVQGVSRTAVMGA
jgi:hypothetical protein